MDYRQTEIEQSNIDFQKRIMAGIREANGLLPVKPLAFVETFGCQQNESDSEKLRGMLSEMGYAFASKADEADVVVINTCAVREHAEKRALGNVGALVHSKKAHPSQIIALCGCMVQQPSVSDRIKRSYRHVDIVFGPQVLWRFPEFLGRALDGGGRVFSVEDEPGSIVEGLPALRDGKTKAWLSIMYGCNNFCSYCIVPYVRGRERSRRPKLIAEEAERLVSGGYKDITLLGQNVNSYGRDLGQGISFPDLLKTINGIDGEFLIRFMTSHPKDAGEKLFRTMAECEKVERHIHLPFQAGNDRVLAEMNRKYTRADYLALVETARRFVPDIVITSDVIVGFPGETYDEFRDTLSVLETVRFDALFTFIYSKRPGTPAAAMADPVPKEEKQRWFEELVDIQNGISEEKHALYIGTTMRVLVDGKSGDENYPLTARTNGGRLVHLRGDAGKIGSFTDVLITGSNTWSLFGETAASRSGTPS